MIMLFKYDKSYVTLPVAGSCQWVGVLKKGTCRQTEQNVLKKDLIKANSKGLDQRN